MAYVINKINSERRFRVSVDFNVAKVLAFYKKSARTDTDVCKSIVSPNTLSKFQQEIFLESKKNVSHSQYFSQQIILGLR